MQFEIEKYTTRNACEQQIKPDGIGKLKQSASENYRGIRTLDYSFSAINYIQVARGCLFVLRVSRLDETAEKAQSRKKIERWSGEKYFAKDALLRISRTSRHVSLSIGD